MAVVHSLTEAIDNLYTTTWQNMKSKATDQIFDATPFWFWLKEHGHLKAVEGGRFITEPLRYAKSERVQFIGRGGTVNLDRNEYLTAAIYDWKYLVDSLVRFGVDDQKNRGKNQIMSQMETDLSVSQQSLIDQMETSLFSENSDVLAFLGLRDVVQDDPTNDETFAAINQQNNTWWRNQFKDMASESFAAFGLARMRTLFNNCGNNMSSDFPDFIVSGQTPYERYEDSVEEQKRIVNKKLGDASFENIEYKGVPMVWSPACANTRMYFLNTRHLNFTYDPMMFFDMTEWKPIPDQVNDRAAQIILAGELTTGRRRVHGVLFGMDTD